MHEIELTREERELLETTVGPGERQRREASDVIDLSSATVKRHAPLDWQRQLEVLETFHQDVAERFADALSRCLQRLVEVQLTGVHVSTYSQFAFGRSRPTCYFVIQAAPLPAALALDVTPALLYPILDALLGGGKQACPIPCRAPTELEQRLAQRVIRLLLDELHDAWEPLLAVNLSIERVESDAQRVRVVAPADDVIVLTFSVRLNEQTGEFSMCLPQRAIRKIVDKLLVGEFTGSEGTALQSSATATEGIELMVELDAKAISSCDLDNLREGDVLLTDVEADGLVDVSIDGRLAYRARPAAFQGRRAVVLASPVPDTESSR